jgi:formylglycine-generating enzyme required for sulfatase activity
VGLFYYAGHGLQVRGTNFLVPVDANPIRETDLDFQMLDANLVLRQMEGAGTKLNLVILDACRNNPFGGRSLRAVDRGLAIMQAPEGTLISFATQPGNVARDGTDGDSPYTKALAQTMRKPGLDVFRTFNEVGLAVANATGGMQQPWVSLSPIRGDFYFVEPSASAPTAAVTAGPSEAERAWGFVRDTTSQEVLEDFIRRYGNSIWGTLAHDQLERLKAKTQVAVVASPVAPPGPSAPCDANAAGVSLTSRSAAPLSTAEECLLKPKDAFKECAHCPEMVVVPAGTFMMGSPPSDWRRSGDEDPSHRVIFARQFAVGRFQLMFDEWDACIADGGCNSYRPNNYSGLGRGRQPAVNISWDHANAYTTWLTKKTGKSYRLLTEAEYEYAARAGTRTGYPWGDDIGTNNANCARCGSKWDTKQTAPVGSFPANGFGLYDTVGNVWEWVQDCYHDNYIGAPSDGAAWTSGDCSRRVTRGGSYTSSPADIRVAFRNRFDLLSQDPALGFRVARTLIAP